MPASPALRGLTQKPRRDRSRRGRGVLQPRAGLLCCSFRALLRKEARIFFRGSARVPRKNPAIPHGRECAQGRFDFPGTTPGQTPKRGKRERFNAIFRELSSGIFDTRKSGETRGKARGEARAERSRTGRILPERPAAAKADCGPGEVPKSARGPFGRQLPARRRLAPSRAILGRFRRPAGGGGAPPRALRRRRGRGGRGRSRRGG